MSTEQNKAIVRRFIAAINEQDLDALDKVAAPELAQRWKEAIPEAYARFAGNYAEITDLIAEGDKVVARLATSGRHTGEWLGIPATGKQWTNRGVFFCRLSDGKIVEQEGLFNRLDHLLQLGAKIVPPEQGGA
jgi:predicted ester cyclase